MKIEHNYPAVALCAEARYDEGDFEPSSAAACFAAGQIAAATFDAMESDAASSFAAGTWLAAALTFAADT